MALRRDQSTLLAATAVSVAVWVIPIVRPLMLPLIYLNTHIHELCHAVTALVTGGHVSYIAVHADGSGVTPVSGGSLLLTASAGYVGSALVGGLMIAFSRTPKQATNMVWLAFGFIVASMLLFVRGDMIGILSGLFWILALAMMAKKLTGPNIVFAAQFIGMQLALTSLQSFLVLLKLTSATEVHSDAEILYRVTGIPSFAWALGWSIFGLALVGVSLHSAWKSPAKGSD